MPNYGINQVMTAALATGLFVSRCTITRLPSPMTVGPSGSPTAAYVPVTALTAIRCMMAVTAVMLASPTVNEVKSEASQITSNDWHCLLETYYPTIETVDRAIVDGILYDIVGIDHDSQFQMTRLRLRKVDL